MATQKLPSEHVEQVNFVNWVKYNYPKIRLFAPPNGAHLNGTPKQKAMQMNKLKAEGFSPGVPALVIPNLFLFIAMKNIKGSTTSKDQLEWREHLIECGYTAEICKGAAEAKEVFLKTLTGQSS